MLIKVNLPVAGSNIERWRFDSASGNTLAEGWSDPFLQKSGFAGGRTRAVIQTRPFSSIIGLWLLVCASQIGSSPQYGDGPIGASFEDGVLGSRTGSFHFRGGVVLRVQDRDEIRALLRGPVELAVGVDRGFAPVGRDLVVEIGGGPTQSHRVRTTLRSMPCGRVGCANGSSPAAIRSVQSPNSLNASGTSSRPITVVICVKACPDWMRRSRPPRRCGIRPAPWGWCGSRSFRARDKTGSRWT